MPDGKDGCKRYKMTREDGSIFYAKTYGRDSITDKITNDKGWVHTHDHNGIKCYQWGAPIGEPTVSTALDLTGEPKVVDLPTIQTLTLTETIALAGAALSLKANASTAISLDECAQSVLGYSIKLMQT